jgi:hypothetical protein
MQKKSGIVPPKKLLNHILSFARIVLGINRFENRNDFFVQLFGGSRPKPMTIRRATNVFPHHPVHP